MPSMLAPLTTHLKTCTKCISTFDGRSTSINLCKEGKRLYRHVDTTADCIDRVD